MITNKFDLTNRSALITGAAGLLGKQHAKALLECNANIVLTDIDIKKITNLKNDLESQNFPGKIIAHRMDVTDPNSIKKVSNELKKIKLEPDILINNAAINPIVSQNSLIEGSRLENFDNNIWDKEIAVGLTGTFNCCKLFGKEMAKKSTRSVIVNIASDLSVIAPDQRLYELEGIEKNHQPVKPITYSVIKHGIIGITKYISTYWNNCEIRCNALSPGGVRNDQGEKFMTKIKKKIPLGRMAEIDEYKSAIQFLCSDASAYMNGHNLIIDGGRSIW